MWNATFHANDNEVISIEKTDWNTPWIRSKIYLIIRTLPCTRNCIWKYSHCAGLVGDDYGYLCLTRCWSVISRCETIFWPPYILTPGSIYRTIFWPRGQYIVTIFWPPSLYFDPPPNSTQNSFVGYDQLLNVYCYRYIMIMNSERIG